MRRRGMTWLAGAVACLALLALPAGAGDDGFQVDAPIERDFVPRTFPVVGRVPDVPSPVVAVNGAEVAVKAGHFKTFLTAPRDGEFKVRVAFGGEGMPASVVERVVRVDGTPPALTVLEPEGPVGEVDAPEAVVRGVVEDPTFDRLTLNGAPASIDVGGRFSATFMLAKGAELAVEFVARDVVGNETRVVRTLRRRGGAPAPPGPGAAPEGPASATTTAMDLCFVLDRALPVGAEDAWLGSLAALKELGLKPEKGDRLGIYAFDATTRVEAPLLEPVDLSAWKPEAAPRVVSRAGLRPTVERVAADLATSLAAVRHVVLVLGNPSAAGTELADLAPALSAAGITLSVIAIGGANRAAGLDALARDAGGRLFVPKVGPELLRTLRGEVGIAAGNRRRASKPPGSGSGAPERPVAAPSELGPVSPTVRSAVEWLRTHQAADGSWKAAEFGAWCDGRRIPGAATAGPGRAIYDVGVTGLALLALMSAGAHSASGGRMGEAVLTGLRFLRDVQDAEGCFGPRSSGHFVYNHAIATLAMVEGYGASRSPVERESAQRALDFVALARNPYFAWRYGVRPGDNDTSVTGWMALALFAAKRVNRADVRSNSAPTFSLDEEAFDGMKAWIEKMTDPDFGRVGYQQRGSGPARPTELVDRFPAEKSESMTAVGLLIRTLLGENPRTSEPLQKGATLCAALLPSWNELDGSIDLYYWHYATLAMASMGGEGARRWREAVEWALVGSQRKSGDFCGLRGSWDPVDPWGPDGGRVYMTAMAVLCLQGARPPR